MCGSLGIPNTRTMATPSKKDARDKRMKEGRKNWVHVLKLAKGVRLCCFLI